MTTAADQYARPVACKYRTLLWDIDGTLIDTTSLIVAALDHTFRKFMGTTLSTPELRAIIGIPLSTQVLAVGNPQVRGYSAAEMEAEFIRYYERNREMESILEPAVEALVRGVRAGHATALVTSKNRVELRNTLPRLGIQQLVQVIVSADDVERPKPAPDAVLRALSILGAEVTTALFIGDTVHDMRAGHAAGVSCCAVTWGAGPRELLLAEKPELMCDDPLDLAGLLGLTAAVNL